MEVPRVLGTKFLGKAFEETPQVCQDLRGEDQRSRHRQEAAICQLGADCGTAALLHRRYADVGRSHGIHQEIRGAHMRAQ